MKKKMIITTMVTALVLTGCGSSVPNLSKLDNSKASEYLAGELMKYDSSYQYGLDYDRSVLEPTPIPTVAPTPVPSKAPADDSGKGSEASAGTGEKPAMQEVSLTDIFGMDGVDIKLVSSSLKKSLDEDYTYFTASDGKKLLVLYFNIKNTGNKSKEVNLKSAKPEYYLLKDGDSVGNLQQTIAEGDMQYFKQNIKAGKSNQAVLVFEVDKGLSLNNVSLAITKDGKQATVALK